MPALKPPKTREMIKMVKLWPAANINSETAKNTKPIHIINFLPNLSASVPPNGEIIICDNAKAATSIPKSLPFNPKSFKYTGSTGITNPIPKNIRNILK